MNAAERADYLRALEFASPSFLEFILKTYRMAHRGATTPTGKFLTDEQGEPKRLSGFSEERPLPRPWGSGPRGWPRSLENIGPWETSAPPLSGLISICFYVTS
jgi:hypothetical protein